MEFNVNHPILYVIVGAIIALVLVQSVFFLVRAVKRAKELGISKETVKKTISSSAIFTIGSFLISNFITQESTSGAGKKFSFGTSIIMLGFV